MMRGWDRQENALYTFQCLVPAGNALRNAAIADTAIVWRRGAILTGHVHTEGLL